MPTYEYRCSNCEHSFEELLKMSDRKIPETQPCPNCKQENTVQQLCSAAALVSPFAIDGLKKPASDFRDRMQQIKEGHKKMSGVKIKEY